MADRRNTVAVLRRKLTELRTLVARLLGRQHDAVTMLDGDTPDTASSAATLQRIRRGVLGAADRASRADSGDRGVELSLRGAAAADALAISALRQEPHDLTGGQDGALEARTGLQRALDLIDDAQQTLDQAQLQQAQQPPGTNNYYGGGSPSLRRLNFVPQEVSSTLSKDVCQSVCQSTCQSVC